MIMDQEYPYMYARVSAKRAKLLDRSDYEKLLKMKPNEIARYLGERDYREEIDELGDRHDGVALVELALNRNLSRMFSHLCSISPPSLERVLNTYLRKYDIVSLKRLLRWKKGGERENVEDLMVPVGSLSFGELEELSEKSFEEIVESISFPDSGIDYCGSLDAGRELSEIERILDRCYHEELKELATDVNSTHFSRFIKAELEYENLRTALRLKKYGFEAGEIRKHFATEKESSLLDEVLDASDLEEAIEAVKSSGRVEGLETGRLEDLEHALEIERLEDAFQMLHVEPLGTTSILGYMIAKMIEVKNLRMLIRAKETGIQNQETIRRNLVLPRR